MDRFPFDHLSLAQVAEHEKLAENLTLFHLVSPRNEQRFAWLDARRHPPIYQDQPTPAA